MTMNIQRGNNDTDEDYRRYYIILSLVMIEGTYEVQKFVLNNLPRAQTLPSVLQSSNIKVKFMNENSRLLNEKQRSILYPPMRGINLDDIDLTLWLILARNVTRGDLKLYFRKTDPPSQLEISPQHDVIRIYNMRNTLCHHVLPSLDTTTYEEYWNHVEQALHRLDSDINLENYRNMSLNKDRCDALREKAKLQMLDEMNSHMKKELDEKNRQQKYSLLIFGLVVVALCSTIFFIVWMNKNRYDCGDYVRSRSADVLGSFSFLDRRFWKPMAAQNNMSALHLPVNYTIITHTADMAGCSTPEKCCQAIRGIQHYHMKDRHWADIGFHYLIGKDGIVYQGRDIKFEAAAVQGWNSRIISIAFLGNFMYTSPTQESVSALEFLLHVLEKNNILISNFTIYGMCEVRDTASPGKYLYDRLFELQSYMFPQLRHHSPNYCFFNQTQVDHFDIEDDQKELNTENCFEPVVRAI